MTNVFQVTNSVHKTNVRIGQLEAGRVFFRANHAFVRLPKPIASNMVCSACGQAMLNVHNFACAVHFCPTDYYDVEISDFVLTFPQS